MKLIVKYKGNKIEIHGGIISIKEFSNNNIWISGNSDNDVFTFNTENKIKLKLKKVKK